MASLTEKEIFDLAYASYNEDAGPLLPDNEIRESLMEDLRPVFLLFYKKLINEINKDGKEQS